MKKVIGYIICVEIIAIIFSSIPSKPYEEVSLSTLMPIINKVKGSSWEEGREYLRQSLLEYTHEKVASSWKMVGDDELFFEFRYENNRYIAVHAKYCGYPFFEIVYNGPKPNLEILASYYNGNFRIFEMEDNDTKNTYLNITNVVK